jgi:phosphoglycolate phosphatase
MLQTIKAAIIDLDGTMLDTAPDFLVAINRMRADFHLAPTDIETIKQFVGKGSENLIQRALSLDFSETQIARHFNAALASYQTHYLAVNGLHSALYPQVIEGLQRLQTLGLRLACVTNKPLAFALPLLEQKGLRDFFDIVYGGDSFAHKKPDPVALLQVCRDFALDPAQVVAIGDSSNDAAAARAAGCPVLHVPYGYNHGEPIQNLDTDGIVSTLLEAAHLIASNLVMNNQCAETTN